MGGYDETGQPPHVAASGLLVTNTAGLTLLVANPYREGLVLPGGVIETGESPADAAARECREEVGLDLPVGRLLAVQHKPLGPRQESGLVFVFDTDPVPADVDLTLQADEITAVHWLSPAEAVERHTAAGQARLAAAFGARVTGRTAYLDVDRSLL
jgi:8-oxo-dGTP pyrophosphatase MutT (NUDIX family)